MCGAAPGPRAAEIRVETYATTLPFFIHDPGRTGRRGRPAAGAAPCWQGQPGQGSLSSRQPGPTFTQAADLTLSVVKILCLALTQPGIDRNSQKLAISHQPII